MKVSKENLLNLKGFEYETKCTTIFQYKFRNLILAILRKMNKRELIVMDFLFQKYPIEYFDNMTSENAIRQVQGYLFPKEQDTTQNFGQISQTKDDHTKLCLYKTTLIFEEYLKYQTKLTYFDGPISPQSVDLNQVQFFLYRPLINIFLYINYVEGKTVKQSFQMIFPIKKPFSILKTYILKQLQEIGYTFGNNTDIILYQLLDDPDNTKFSNNDFTLSALNDAQIYVKAVSSISYHTPYNETSDNVTLYYYLHDPFKFTSQKVSPYSIEFDDFDSHISIDTFVRKIQNDQSEMDWDCNLMIIFNGIVQSTVFPNMADLFSDSMYYRFVVVNQYSKLNDITHFSPFHDLSRHNIPVPRNGRTFIIDPGYDIEMKTEEVNQIDDLPPTFISSSESQSDEKITKELIEPKVVEIDNEPKVIEIETTEIENTLIPYTEKKDDNQNSEMPIMREPPKLSVEHKNYFYDDPYRTEFSKNFKKTFPDQNDYEELIIYSDEELLDKFIKYYQIYADSQPTDTPIPSSCPKEITDDELLSVFQRYYNDYSKSRK